MYSVKKEEVVDDCVVRPDVPILIESTRSIGYSFESAVADIIDNSISKAANSIHICFDSTEPQYLSVVDNGVGMTLDELKDAMKYGSRSSLEVRDENDLGRFGLGLKMASFSQCRQLTVISKKNEIINAVEWNLDYIIQEKDWALIIYNSNEIKALPIVNYLDEYNSGTIVLWRNFDRIKDYSSKPSKFFDEAISKARDHVALVFHRYLNGEDSNFKINIYFNNLPVKAIDPFMLDNPATQRLPEESIPINGKSILIKPYVIPFVSKLSVNERNLQEQYSNNLHLNQGFYVYRNRRLIIWGTWFRLIRRDELNGLARVRVDIPNNLDSIWNIDVKKSSAELPDTIKHRLADIVRGVVGRSERVYRYRGRKVTEDENLEHPWNVYDKRGKIGYSINKETLFYKNVLNSIPEESLPLFNAFVLMLEHSFPFSDVYCRLSKLNGNYTEVKALDEDVYNAGKCFIKTCSEYFSNEEIFKLMYKHDFFKNYKEIIDKLKEEKNV